VRVAGDFAAFPFEGRLSCVDLVGLGVAKRGDERESCCAQKGNGIVHVEINRVGLKFVRAKVQHTFPLCIHLD
jgi:hypothetical protein